MFVPSNIIDGKRGKCNDISAVAITDHFKIDKDRILHLKELAPNIVFFPGVELRTDKGANNLHLILIFSNEIDLDVLSADFEAIMLRTKSKSRGSDETIYWSYEDIVDFCKSHNGLLSIHAGNKSNGIDKEISNALPVKEAIKADIAEFVDFFEVGRKSDIETYHKYVFKDIKEKPIIICSDCHDPRNYTTKESLWIKGKLTFSGLMQCIYQPSVIELVSNIMLAVDEDIDNSERKIMDKENFYDFLYDLNYLDVSFKLKMGGRDLEELSPGERGIVLLIFYLALSQNSIPIIIDQPEDNLDNQSVYNKLVPCICAAKQKRQVIIVTHNPNIAVACDAEQIICCSMDKNTHTISYNAGAIEDDEIKNSVVDILEGTMPAFDLRRRKYV